MQDSQAFNRINMLFAKRYPRTVVDLAGEAGEMVDGGGCGLAGKDEISLPLLNMLPEQVPVMLTGHDIKVFVFT